MPQVSAIIVNHSPIELLRKCIENFEEQDYPNCEIVIVDNSPFDECVKAITFSHPKLKLVKPHKNLGYAGGCNLGLKHAQGEFVAFLNTDAFPEKNWLSELVSVLVEDPKVAVVGSKILRGDKRTIDSAGVVIEYPSGDAYGRGYLSKDLSHHEQLEEVPSVGGAAFIARSSTLRLVGAFDESFFMYHEETDLCWRVRLAGYKVVYNPKALVYHLYPSKDTVGRIKFQSKNRLASNLKNLERRSLMGWFAYEASFLLAVVLAFFVIRNYRSYALAYLKGCFKAVCDLRVILEERAKVSSLRRLPDKDVLVCHKKANLIETFHRYVKQVKRKGLG